MPLDNQDPLVQQLLASLNISLDSPEAKDKAHIDSQVAKELLSQKLSDTDEEQSETTKKSNEAITSVLSSILSS